MFALRIGEEGLSVIELADLSSKATVERATVAFALARNKIRPIGYRCIARADLDDLGLRFTSRLGTSPDRYINGCHREILHVDDSISKELALRFGAKGFGEQIKVAELIKLITYGRDAGHFKIGDILNERLRAEVLALP